MGVALLKGKWSWDTVYLFDRNDILWNRTDVCEWVLRKSK